MSVGGPQDSGLVILLSVGEGAIEVETGYGLEGALPDGKVGAVIDQEGLPHFQEKRYGRGLVGLTSAYAAILAGEEFEIAAEKKDSGWLSAFIIFVLIVLLLRRSRRYPPGGSAGGGGGTHRPVIIPRAGMPRGGSIGRSGGFGGGRSGGGGAGRRF
ncbi:MAG TPA: TPM domain-containing protein [Firmicutes bacterium]|nr:TPM domain-containing protein [Bacillota bacterium]